MKDKIKYAYLATVLLSVLIYSIPFEFGGNILRWAMVLLLFLAYLFMLSLLFKEVDQSERFTVALMPTNAIVVLHLILIFISLMYDSTATLIVGLILGAIIYKFGINQMKQRI